MTVRAASTEMQDADSLQEAGLSLDARLHPQQDFVIYFRSMLGAADFLKLPSGE